jgi:hypothetical protein
MTRQQFKDLLILELENILFRGFFDDQRTPLVFRRYEKSFHDKIEKIYEEVFKDKKCISNNTDGRTTTAAQPGSQAPQQRSVPMNRP